MMVTVFVSCEKEKDNNEGIETPTVKTDVAYIVNYGSYSGSKGEISIYNIDDNNISHEAYKTANSIELTSNIQSMTIHNDIAYLMSNNGDKIDIIDAKTLKASVNPIADDITKPRYFAANGNTAYISCWGDVQDWGKMATSYIAKVNLTTKEVTKIPLAGGTEGLIISNDKLYIGLCADSNVAVMDLATEAISKIRVSAVAQQFVEDIDGNIWVSLVSKYSTPFPADSLGMAIIDPTTDKILKRVSFSGIGGDGYMHISADKQTVYVMGAEAWPGTASTIFTADVASRTLSSTALITGEKFYGFNINPKNEDVYVCISPDASTEGALHIYDKAGTKIEEKETGIGPNHVIFYEK